MRPQRQLRVLDPHIEAESMDTAIKAAFATTDMKTVDQHFGAAESFAVYAVGPEGSHLVEVTQFDRIAMDGAEDKLAGKIESLAGCAVVYCNAVGASAIAQLKGADIQPLKVASGSSIAGLIDGLRSELQTTPSSWLARSLARQRSGDSADRFAAMEAEGWEE